MLSTFTLTDGAQHLARYLTLLTNELTQRKHHSVPVLLDKGKGPPGKGPPVALTLLRELRGSS